MTKQEFLAMSLPYELHGITANRVALINGVEYEKELPIIWRGETFSGRCGFGIMPILHPLSDLTKEIEHKGEKFVPIEILSQTFPDIDFYHGIWYNGCGKKTTVETSISPKEDKHLTIGYFFKSFLKLIEWHFDIAGLIEKGEAIDINTLTENPYK